MVFYCSKFIPILGCWDSSRCPSHKKTQIKYLASKTAYYQSFKKNRAQQNLEHTPGDLPKNQSVKFTGFLVFLWRISWTDFGNSAFSFRTQVSIYFTVMCLVVSKLCYHPLKASVFFQYYCYKLENKITFRKTTPDPDFPYFSFVIVRLF